MRIRSIKPEFWSSEDVAGLDWPTRLLFIGLWSYVDDNGVGRDVEKLIAASLFALEDDPRDTLATVSRGLQTLFQRGQITRYTDAGKPYLYINAWEKHQKIDRPAKPRYPLPPADTPIRDTLATPSRDPRDTLATGSEEQGNRGTEVLVVKEVGHVQVNGDVRDDLVDLETIARATRGDHVHAGRVARDVLSKAKTKPADPTAFVLTAVRADPARHRANAPTTSVRCPEHAMDLPCLSCASDRKVAR